MMEKSFRFVLSESTRNKTKNYVEKGKYYLKLFTKSRESRLLVVIVLSLLVVILLKL